MIVQYCTLLLPRCLLLNFLYKSTKIGSESVQALLYTKKVDEKGNEEESDYSFSIQMVQNY